MKSTLFQYVSLTVMMLLLVVVVSMLPEQATMKNSMLDHSPTGAIGLSVVKSQDN